METPQDWTPPHPTDKTLKTRAHTSWGESHVVHLRLADFDGKPAWLLDIDGTPGKWYMSTLLEGVGEGRPISDTLWIDAGANWQLLNYGEIMREAMTLV